jgi:hypothetical protein
VGFVASLSGATVAVANMQVALVQFNDVQASPLTYYGSSNQVQLTPQQRTLPVGSLNQAVYAVNICTSGSLGSSFTISVDGVAHADMDDLSYYPGSPTAINGFYVYKLYIPLSVGSQHTVSFTLSSAACYISVVACPWILTTSTRGGHQPVTFNFSQLSTFYVNLGSLYADLPKNSYVGTRKGVSYGQSDYYASGTATNGVLQFSYTFTSLSVSLVAFVADSSTTLGGCVENIGVDIQ